MNDSPEQLGAGKAGRSELTTVEVQSRIDRTSSLLARLRAYPSDWTSKNGESKQEVEKKLEDALSSMGVIRETLSESDTDAVGTEWDDLRSAPTRNTLDQQKVHLSEASEEAPAIYLDVRPASESNPSDIKAPHSQPRARFFEVDGTYIPITPRSSRKTTEWEAVPGKMTVSGGEKFSEVKFIRDKNGLTTVAKPGEKMDFIESARNERLESIDTLLQGRHELKSFNSIYQDLASTTSEYNGLNPDSPDYDERAKELAAQIDSLILQSKS